MTGNHARIENHNMAGNHARIENHNMTGNHARREDHMIRNINISGLLYIMK
ncbi:hypothetical protein SAMN05660484_02112 [Eubacterium ruminantium]|uniref:Uncharacterized protein n=1 Tax=Eubacterium ruminantium TaxID=42322 RepID=A0A1T4PWP0_9FIRM|nr:hypothetical protein SAMN05660484_02112 [Eubacterium ruminantium]SDN13872.1 hypothetical protein SAMN04490370_11115 [Eubacterium ruminantium]SJZ95368.1 hypothetical protein SAMN02745110_02150 [Eubacterium ruminantium]